MSHIYDQDLLADKLMWDSRESRHSEVHALFNGKPYVFNHERYYESHRSEAASAAGKAFSNYAKMHILSEITAFHHVYSLYLEGKRSEEEFKEYAFGMSSKVALLLKNDRDAEYA